ncbi:MAG: ShlB/FhaC/HecB family hemolysin secretion/activation protein, partial [Verrucomicrobiota bacterium]
MANATTLFAQTPPPSAAVDAAAQQAAQFEQQRQAQIDEARRQAEAPATTPGGSLEGEELTETDPDAFKLEFSDLEIKDYTLLEPQFIGGLRLKYEGQSLGMIEVNNILREITNEYVAKGFITCRAYLPEQDITSGKLIIKCVEGKLEGFKGATNPKNIGVKNAFPGLSGKFLNLRDLEQGIDQLNRLPSNDAKMDIQPGKGLGGSLVNLTNDPGKRYRLIQSIDNSGFSTTGEYQARITGQLDNQFGWNEQWTAYYGRDITSASDGNYSEMAGLTFSIPYGYWLFDAGVNYFGYDSNLPLEFYDVNSRGDNLGFSLGGSYLFHRDQNTKS